jgi:SSS family solute:Na+ symporter
MMRSAGTGLASYFVADRSLPWWWLGTSMVATYFAADTPLAITGIIANDGISGNWFWWSWVFTFVTITVFFARKWRQSRVLTDVELIELRYDGRSASLLRAFKAFYLGLVVNCIILGWLFRAMSKITSPFVDWEVLLGACLAATLITPPAGEPAGGSSIASPRSGSGEGVSGPGAREDASARGRACGCWA